MLLNLLLAPAMRDDLGDAMGGQYTFLAGAGLLYR